MRLSTLPETWRLVKLGKITEIVGGGTPSRQNSVYFGGDIPWATPTDITALDDLWIYETKENITEEGLKNSSAKLLPVGTVLMTSRATIGFTALAGREIATNQGFANFICDERVLFNGYLAYYLPFIRDWLIQIAGGTTFKEISKSVLANIDIPLPTLSEQRRIVGVVNQVDGLRRLRRRTKGVIHRLLMSSFAGLFGDPIRTSSAQHRRLGDFASIDAPLVDPRKAVYSDFFHVGGDNIEGNTGQLSDISTVGESGTISSKYLFSERHILYSKIRPALRKVALPSFAGLCSADIYPIDYDESQVRKLFLAQLLRSNDFTTYAIRAATRAQIPKINRDELFAYHVSLPSLDEQDRFVEIAEQAQLLEARINESLNTTNDLFDAVVGTAFTGILTRAWREERTSELADDAVERDIVLGLRSEEPTHGDYKRGHVTQAEREEIEQRISDSLRPVLSQMALYNPFGDTLRAIEAGQARWAEQLAQIMQPISIQLPTIEIAPLLSDAVSNAMLGFQSRLAALNQENWNAMASLTSQYALIADATRSIRETFASSLQPITLQLTTVIENLARAIDEWPPSDHLRFDVIVHLNRRQKLIHFTCERQEQPFTADTIRAESNFSMELVRRDLSLLASLGLISAVSIPAESSEGPTYVNAYRLIPEVDQVLLTDLSVFQSLGQE